MSAPSHGSRRQRRVPVRYVVTAGFVSAIVALTVGPVQAIVEHHTGAGEASGATTGCVVSDPPLDAGRGGVWTTATSSTSSSSVSRRALAAPERLTYARAVKVPAGDVHLVGGRVLRHREAGVTALVSATQRRQLAGLRRAGCASLQAAWDDLDDSVRVRTDDALPAVPTPGPITVRDVVVDEVVPGLDSATGLRAALADGAGHAGLYAVSPAGLTPTVRGRVYGVVAHAVSRGTRDVRLAAGHDGAGSGLSVRAFLRPDGRSSLLVWNPGAERTAVLDVPGGRRVARYTVTIPAGALTAVEVPAGRG